MNADASGDATRPSRILMTADAVGGIWQYCVDLVSQLSRRGVEVLVATMGPRPSEQQKSQLTSLPRVSVIESEYALEWMPGAWDDVDRAGKWLLDLQSDFAPDLIHLNGFSHAALPWHRPVLVVAHSCVYSWWTAVHGSAPPLAEWGVYKQRVERGLWAAKFIVCPSFAMASAIRSEYGVDAGKLKVIHNFSAVSPLPRLTKHPFILSAGRIWDPAKNLALVDKLASQVPWEIRLAGSDHGPDGSRSRATKAHLLGSLTHANLMEEMCRASIFLHPAFYEPFGLSVLEAARANCCLVLADIPSLRELWDGAAIFVNPHDSEQWAFELNELIDNSEKRERLANSASQRARMYTAEAAIAAYCEVYASLGLSTVRTGEVAA